MKLVEIEWWDHATYRDNVWRDKAEIKGLKPQLVRTVGWVAKETKKAVTVVATRAKFGAYCGEMCVARPCIKRIRKLK